jgi:hypothetical protein
MNEALREKVSGLKVKLTDIETKIELGKSKVKLQQGYIETLEQDKEARAKETETLIETAGEEIIKLTSNVTSSTSIVINLKETIIDSKDKEAKEKYGLSDASNAVILKLQSEARKRFFKKKDFRSAVKGTVGILATGEKFVITNKSKNAVKYRILDQDNFPTGEEKTLDKETFKTAVDILYKDGMELQEGLFEQIAEENKNTSNQNTEASTSVLTKEKIEKALKDAQTMSKEDRLKKLKDNLGCKK